jgi:hypothetical protein
LKIILKAQSYRQRYSGFEARGERPEGPRGVIKAKPPVIKYMRIGEASFQLEQRGPKPVLLSATR